MITSVLFTINFYLYANRSSDNSISFYLSSYNEEYSEDFYSYADSIVKKALILNSNIYKISETKKSIANEIGCLELLNAKNNGIIEINNFYYNFYNLNLENYKILPNSELDYDFYNSLYIKLPKNLFYRNEFIDFEGIDCYWMNKKIIITLFKGYDGEYNNYLYIDETDIISLDYKVIELTVDVETITIYTEECQLPIYDSYSITDENIKSFSTKVLFDDLQMIEIIHSKRFYFTDKDIYEKLYPWEMERNIDKWISRVGEGEEDISRKIQKIKSAIKYYTKTILRIKGNR